VYVCVCVYVCVRRCPRRRGSVASSLELVISSLPSFFRCTDRQVPKKATSYTNNIVGWGREWVGEGRWRRCEEAHKLSTQPSLECVQEMRWRKHLRAHPRKKQVHESTSNVAGQAETSKKVGLNLSKVKTCLLTTSLHHSLKNRFQVDARVPETPISSLDHFWAGGDPTHL